MKRNLFYAAMFFAVAVTGLTSCSQDDDLTAPEQLTSQSFFNLTVGNEWTYKKFENSDANPEVLNFSGETDNVRVESVVDIKGVAYSKLKHTITNSTDSDVFVRYEYSRIDSDGHLVSIYHDDESEDFFNEVSESSVALVHPGTDAAYTKEVKYAAGTMNYSLFPNTTVKVEGTDYSVSPYKGIYKPTDPALTSKTIEFDYAKNIGLVKSTSRDLDSKYVSEDRLVSYTLAK
jgi:hypothetical protein